MYDIAQFENITQIEINEYMSLFIENMTSFVMPLITS